MRCFNKSSEGRSYKKLDNPENMKFWQKGLKSYKLLYGISGEKGAQMELEYQMGKRNMVLIETITENKFPAKFHADYDTKGVHNIQKSIFHVSQIDLRP